MIGPNGFSANISNGQYAFAIYQIKMQIICS